MWAREAARVGFKGGPEKLYGTVEKSKREALYKKLVEKLFAITRYVYRYATERETNVLLK